MWKSSLTLNVLDLARTETGRGSGVLGTSHPSGTHGSLNVDNGSTHGGASLTGGYTLELGRHFHNTT